MTPRVLIADDENDVVELIKYHLLAMGCHVETAVNGLEAVEKARDGRPDAIILDLMMPEFDGTAVTEMLRRLPSTGSVPILMLTACSSDAAKLVADNAGVTEFMTKPFSPKELVARVRRLLTPAVIRAEQHC